MILVLNANTFVIFSEEFFLNSNLNLNEDVHP